jgi:hypothetical protein
MEGLDRVTSLRKPASLAQSVTDSGVHILVTKENKNKQIELLNIKNWD